MIELHSIKIITQFDFNNFLQTNGTCGVVGLHVLLLAVKDYEKDDEGAGVITVPVRSIVPVPM